MKTSYAAAFLLLILVAVACNRRDMSDAALQKNLAGLWKFYTNSSGFSSQRQFSSVTTVAADGSYVCQFTNGAASAPAHTLEGTWEIKNGLLVDTVVKLDRADLPSPQIMRAHIVRFDKDGLGVRYEPVDFDGVLRKNAQ